MTRRNKIIIVVGIGVFIIALLTIGLSIRNSKKKVESYHNTYEVTQPEPLIFSGKVRASEKQTIVYDQSLGRIQSIDVTKGAEVVAGDILLTYDSESNRNMLNEKLKMQAQYSTNIANLETDLASERDNLGNINDKVANTKQKIKDTNTWGESKSKSNRLSELQIELNEFQQEQQKTISQMQAMESSMLSYKDMLADVEATIATLESTKQTVVTASFDGVVKIDENGMNNSSVAVVTVYGKSLEVGISVTEYDIEKLEVGKEVSLQYVNQLKEVTGTLSFIDMISESETDTVASYQVNISIDESIPLGYSVQVRVPQEEVHIPIESVVKETSDSEEETIEKYYVFKYLEGKAVKTEVSVETNGNYMRVEKGLTFGDKVIEDPQGLKDQMEVNVQ